jgi:hypothetical protein
MIGLYSGTRIDAMLRLRWLPSPEGGWVDVDNGIIHRRPYLTAAIIGASAP